MRHPVDVVRVTKSFSRSHPGSDYAPPTPGQTGVEVYAPETSVVVASAYQLPVEGHYVILRGLETGKFYYFGHFAERKVQVGRGVAEGEVIGIMGRTGQATNIHTHCEVRDSRNAPFSGKHDPEQWFKEHIKEEEMHPELKVNRGDIDNIRAWLGLPRATDADYARVGMTWKQTITDYLTGNEYKEAQRNKGSDAARKLEQIRQIVK